MANLALTFDLLARDSASGAFRNVGNAADRAGKQTHAFGTTMAGAMKVAGGALLGAGIVEGFKSLYEAAAESAKIGRLTEQVIKTTGGAAGVSAKQVGDLAGAIAKKTGVDDEAIQSGQNLLLTFTNIKNAAGEGNDIFNQTTQIMTDMSTALGKDASSSAIMLGKALNDPIKGITALSRAGVSFTEQQKEQIRTLVESGDTLGAQKIILAELSKEFGGAAEAASTPFEKLQQRLGDLAETLGSNLIPYVDDFATFMMDEVLPAVQDVGGVVSGTLGPALGLAVDLFKDLFDTVGAVVGWFSDLPGPVQAAAVALGSMAALKGPLGSLFDTIRDAGQTAALRALYLKDSLSSVGGAATLAKTGAGGLVSFFGGPWGLALTGAAVGVSLLTSWLNKSDEATGDAKSAAEGYAAALRGANGAIDENIRHTAAKAAEDAGLLTVADDAGIALDQVTDAITNQGPALDAVRKRLEAYIAANTILMQTENGPVTHLNGEAEAAKGALAALELLAGQGPATAESQGRIAQATGAAAAQTDTFTASTDAARAELDEAKQAIDAYKLSLDILSGAHVSAIQLESAFQAAVDAAHGALEGMSGAALDANGNLDLQSEAGRKAADVLLDVRNSGNDLIATMIEQGATSEQVQAKDAELRASFINTAGQMGISKEAALKLADQILGIPGERTTTIKADTSQASAAVDGLVEKIKNAGGRVIYTGADVRNVTGVSANAEGNIIEAYADGGLRPMKGGLASIVAPNTWRVIGDRVKDDEAYIPINNDPRSRNLLAETADRMGYQLVAAETRRLAQGAILAGDYTIPVGLTDAKLKSIEEKLVGPTSPGMVGALNWARSQVGKPYLWGGVGPAGYDCSGFMSAITNVIRGRSPYSRVGATASFPWSGFQAGASGAFMIGSTKNAGGGVGHMAGTLNGVNVESRGGQGVVVGGSARGANDRLFSTRAALTFHEGGIVPNLGIPDIPALVAPGETVRTVKQEAALQSPNVNVRVFIGDRELTDIVRVEAEGVVVGAFGTATARGRYNG